MSNSARLQFVMVARVRPTRFARACLAICLLFSVFAVVGSGPVLAMKQMDQPGKKVSKVMKQFLEAGDRDLYFREELKNVKHGNSKRVKILEALPGREGARLLGLVTDRKELKKLWKSFMDPELQQSVWPYLSEGTKRLMIGDGKENKGFLSEKKQQPLKHVQAQFGQQLSPILPGGPNGRILFENLVRFLDGGDVCRLVLICDHVWPQGRVHLSERVRMVHEKQENNSLRQLGPIKNTSTHWARWLRTSEEERPGLFATLEDGAAYEIWNSASASSKNLLYRGLSAEQRHRALNFEGGVYEQIVGRRFGGEAQTIALNAQSFEAILPTVWERLNSTERSKLLSNHPDRGIRHFSTNLFEGKYDTQLGQHNLEEIDTPSKVDIANTLWPQLELQGRVSWLKNVESGGDPVLYGFYHDLTANKIGGKNATQAKFKALGVDKPGEVVEQIWDLLTEQDKQKLTNEDKQLITQKQQQIQQEQERQRLEQQRIEAEKEQERIERERIELERIERERQRQIEEENKPTKKLLKALNLPELQPGHITTVAGSGTAGFSGDNGPATSAQLNNPWGVFATLDGHIYIADQVNHRVRRVSPQGVITTIAGNGTGGFGGDNGLATSAQLYRPSGVFMSLDGHVFIADSDNHRVRRVTPQGVITTIAGSGRGGFGGDNGPATGAQLYSPYGVFVTLDGHIYITDTVNDRVRRVTPQGVITTIAGSGTYGFGGDNGPATSAQLKYPVGVFVTLDGHIYIADSWNNRVWRVTPQGVITTIAGNGTKGYSGDNGPATSAQLNYPFGVFVTLDGHIYIADRNNDRVRRVTPQGIITTIAGNRAPGFSGDNGPATSAQLDGPSGVFATLDNYLYIADYSNQRIRVVNLNEN